MTVSSLPRHPLLPDLVHSRAVLVGHDDGVPGMRGRWGPAEMTRRLAEVLNSPEAGMAFRGSHTRVLVNPGDPAEVLDAVEEAVASASDALLFYCVGNPARRRECARCAAASGLRSLDGTTEVLKAV